MGNTAVLRSYLKHKHVMLLKGYIKMNIKSSLIICLVQLLVKPDIDVSRHLQKVDTELWDDSWIFMFKSAVRD